ncbi:unnamed protein product [Ceutorhynchus assimilis]|uniref:Small ubiquitin-related modifier n=1 Tax=Ceutorhynchus assimilis TaxID=467358 RepID=A0A9N9Q9F2_9CUCU|nr:unnamed protein product [Ceutorhynchus assimilis]
MSENMKPNENQHMILKVRGYDGTIMGFRFKRNLPFKRLMMAYCERMGIDIRRVRFYFKGNCLEDTDTPISVGMQTGDSIETYRMR